MDPYASKKQNLRNECVTANRDFLQNKLFLEFGVMQGHSLVDYRGAYMSNNINADFYGFDSFEGLPEYWREGFPKGKFKVDKLPKVSQNVTLIKGWYDQTLEPFIKKNKGKALFLHIDCDLYSSTSTIFEVFEDCIQTGTVIVFDEYFNFPEWRKEEHKAFIEFIEKKDFDYKYIGYSKYQVAVMIT